jgi:hypothetical protein
VFKSERKAVTDATSAVQDYSAVLAVGVAVALAVSVIALAVAVHNNG